jgi:thymidylate synthase
MQQFQEVIRKVVTMGKIRKSSVQGVPNKVFPGGFMEFDLNDGFPLITIRDLSKSWRAIVEELLWFLSGSSKVSDLNTKGVHIWDQWATEDCCRPYGLETGDVGRIYGPQWRSWLTRDGKTIDQISNLIDEIRTFSDSKRMMVTTWNPEDVNHAFLVPCHGIFKTVVAEDPISLMLFQRSAALFIGVPFNIASYSLLLLMLAQVTGLKPWRYVHYLPDVHIYENQMTAVDELIGKEPKKLPTVKLNPEIKDLFSFKFDDFELCDYHPHPAIKIPVLI